MSPSAQSKAPESDGPQWQEPVAHVHAPDLCSVTHDGSPLDGRPYGGAVEAAGEPAGVSDAAAHDKRVQHVTDPTASLLADLDALLGVTHGPVPDLANAGPAAATRMLMINAVRRHGRYIGGAAPYGYRLTYDQPHHNPGKATRGERQGHFEPEPAQAPILQEIFDRILAGDGQTTLIHDLTRRAVPPPTGRRPTGWTAQAIHDPGQPALHRLRVLASFRRPPHLGLRRRPTGSRCDRTAPCTRPSSRSRASSRWPRCDPGQPGRATVAPASRNPFCYTGSTALSAAAP